MIKSRIAPLIVMILLLSSTAPNFAESTLEENEAVAKVPANLQSYNLFLDKAGNSGGDGMITTIEPDGAQEEASILSGVEFRSDDLIGDIQIFGQGSSNEVQLYVYLQFQGQENSKADLTFTLNSVGGPTYTETIELNDPCTPGFLGNSCSWTLNEIYFSVPADGFKVEKGSQLRLQIDGSADCEGQGGIGAGDCDVLVAFGDMESANGFSRIAMKANALADSSVRVHEPGGAWTDPEKLEWEPNHRPDYRTIQFSVDIRDAFGRDDIHSVNLVLTSPSGTQSIFDKEFEDDDLRLDNNGLVGNYTWTYDAGIPSGEYNLTLEIVDVQGHNVIYNHQGVEILEYGMFLSLPVDQSDDILIAPGQQSSAEFMVEHTGSASTPMEVEFELFTGLPPSWPAPEWDQPMGYYLSSGGSFKIATLTIEVPEDDLSDTPPNIEVWARGFIDNDDGVREEVVVEKITLGIEEVGVYEEARLNVYEDEDHQIEIADSNRPDAFDETLSHYIDSESFEGSEFYVDLFNAGFDTDQYRLVVEEAPSSSWTFEFFDNDTKQPLSTQGPYAITSDVGSHEILPLQLKIFPPSNRDDVDIGLVTVACYSVGDVELISRVSFTVHRTFGILAEVTADSDGGQEIGKVGPVEPGSEVSFTVRVTDSTEESGENTWRLISPGKLDKNTNQDTGNPSYGTWDYSMVDDNGSDVVAIRLSTGQYTDVEVTINMRDRVEAGNHTLFLRVTEELTDGDDEPRYFDLPLKIEVKESLKQGRIFVERIPELIPFLPNQEQNIEFRVENSNNVELDVIISAQKLPDGWAASFTTGGSSDSGNTILLTIPAFGTDEFTLILTAPDDIVAGRNAEVVLSVEPLNENISTKGLKQTPIFTFTTTCEGLDCIVSAALDFQSPQTIGLYVGILLIALIAVYRRGQASARLLEQEYEERLEIEKMSSELVDIPEPVTDEEEEEDDLELLEELEEL